MEIDHNISVNINRLGGANHERVQVPTPKSDLISWGDMTLIAIQFAIIILMIWKLITL